MISRLKSRIGTRITLYLVGGGEIRDVTVKKLTDGIEELLEIEGNFSRKGVFRIKELAGFLEISDILSRVPPRLQSILEVLATTEDNTGAR